jgi:RsiW-degrading membrane proteinase PrsW (M82 family)
MLAVAAVAPGIALLSYFYLRDLYESEPLRAVLQAFMLGMAVVLPVVLIQQFLIKYVTSSVMHILVVAAGTEELFKFLILLLFMFRSKEVNEVYDGILYAVAISLGFATVENMINVLPNGLETAIIRALLPVPGHALFAVVMGYYAGKAKFSNLRSKVRKLAQALIYAWCLHAAYDFILSSSHYVWGLSILPFMLGLWILGLRKIKSAQERSPFRPKD